MELDTGGECRTLGSPNNTTDAASFKKCNKKVVLYYSPFHTLVFYMMERWFGLLL